MLTAIVFALVLVAAQMVGALIMMRLFMSKRFIKKYYAMMMGVIEEVTDEMDF